MEETILKSFSSLVARQRLSTASYARCNAQKSEKVRDASKKKTAVSGANSGGLRRNPRNWSKEEKNEKSGPVRARKLPP